MISCDHWFAGTQYEPRGRRDWEFLVIVIIIHNITTTIQGCHQEIELYTFSENTEVFVKNTPFWTRNI